MSDLTTAPPRRLGASRFDLGPTVWEPLGKLRNELDRLFDDFVVRPGAPSVVQRMLGAAMPALSMTEDETGYQISAELPGLELDDVEVTVAENGLRIAGEKREEREEKSRDCFVSERRYGSFERLVDLPSDADRSSVEATFSKGVLTIRFKRDQQAKPAVQRIAIKAA